MSSSLEVNSTILLYCVGVRSRNKLIYRYRIRTCAPFSLHISGFSQWSHRPFNELRQPRKGCRRIGHGFYSPPNHESGSATFFSGLIMPGSDLARLLATAWTRSALGTQEPVLLLS